MSRLVVLLGALLLLAGCETPSGPAPRIALSRSHHDRVVRAEQGQLLEVRLASGPPSADRLSGGPRWDIDRLDSPPLTLAEPPRYEPPAESGAAGQGSTVFVFQAASPGRAMVRLVYRHPWQQAVNGETFLVWVHVR